MAIGESESRRKLIKIDDWKISQARFDSDINSIAETIFCQGNGYQGIRGIDEEPPANGKLRLGGFIAGLFEFQPSKLLNIKGKKVLPDVFCRAANVPNYLKIEIEIDGKSFSAEACAEYSKYLDMRTGELVRECVWILPDKRRTKVQFRRTVSLSNPYMFASRISIKPENYSSIISIKSSIDAEICSDYFATELWNNITSDYSDEVIALSAQTPKSKLLVDILCNHTILADDNSIDLQPEIIQNPKQITCSYQFEINKGHQYFFDKICWAKWRTKKEQASRNSAQKEMQLGFDEICRENSGAWQNFWDECDINIEGDVKAQQGIRFCLSNLRQAYRESLPTSVTAKGLTGEVYGLLCFWDSEIYLLPFYLYNMPDFAKQILMFRYNTLDQARQRAKLMEYEGAMFPWMTVNGEENPSAWECVLGEQHINAAVPYAISHYVNATDDYKWLAEYGSEIVIETARFWASRVFFNKDLDQYVINGVTGPDEYTEMVSNNAYTNMMAGWVLEYATKVVRKLKDNFSAKWDELAKRINFDEAEIKKWNHIANNMYVPASKNNITPQDDTFFGLDDLDLKAIHTEDYPLESNWPWPQVLRHRVLKQPDVVLANFLLGDKFSEDQKKANYRYYEPKTTHDSSLSPSIHSIMAAELGTADDAYNYFLRSVRLDLDYGQPSDGIHLANSSGAWMALVFGFAGMRVSHKEASFKPSIPSPWASYKFRILIKGRKIGVTVTQVETLFSLLEGEPLEININNDTSVLQTSLQVATKVLNVTKNDRLNYA